MRGEANMPVVALEKFTGRIRATGRSNRSEDIDAALSKPDSGDWLRPIIK
jgi:hypothetical protein